MKSYIYTVFDTVSKQFMPIFEVNNDQVAIREFNQIFVQNKNMDKKDFELLRIARIDRDYESDEENPGINVIGTADLNKSVYEFKIETGE